jgi:TRAP-type transport system periplasmic protein
MKKVIGAAVVALVLVFAFTPTASAKEEYRLKLAGWFPPIGYTKAMIWFGDQIEMRTNQRVKVDEYLSASLVPAREELPALEKGIADIACISPDYYPGRMPLWRVAQLPGIIRDVFVAGKAMKDLAEVPVMKEELAKSNALFLAPMGSPTSHLISSKPVQTLKDLKGMKIRAIGMQADMIKALGAVPVSMSMPDTYTSLQRKTIDGAVHAIGSHILYKWYEPCKFVTKLDLGGMGWFLAVNKTSWSNLPEDIQQVIKEVCTEWAVVWPWAYSIRAEQEGYGRVFPQAGVKVFEISVEDKAIVDKIGSKPVWNEWAAGLETKGLPAKEILDKWLTFNKKWSAASPFAY